MEFSRMEVVFFIKAFTVIWVSLWVSFVPSNNVAFNLQTVWSSSISYSSLSSLLGSSGILFCSTCSSSIASTWGAILSIGIGTSFSCCMTAFKISRCFLRRCVLYHSNLLYSLVQPRT